jgi:hypothetical protein
MLSLAELAVFLLLPKHTLYYSKLLFGNMLLQALVL